MFNVNYLECRARGFTNSKIFGGVFINLAEVSDGDVKTAPEVNFHYTFSRHAGMILTTFSREISSIWPAVLVKTSIVILLFVSSTICGTAVIFLGRNR